MSEFEVQDGDRDINIFDKEIEFKKKVESTYLKSSLRMKAISEVYFKIFIKDLENYYTY